MIKYIIGFIIVYLASSFIQADLDFRNWSETARGLTIIAWIVSTNVYIEIKKIND